MHHDFQNEDVVRFEVDTDKVSELLKQINDIDQALDIHARGTWRS